jgi:hypothetical protein
LRSSQQVAFDLSEYKLDVPNGYNSVDVIPVSRL